MIRDISSDHELNVLFTSPRPGWFSMQQSSLSRAMRHRYFENFDFKGDLIIVLSPKTQKQITKI